MMRTPEALTLAAGVVAALVLVVALILYRRRREVTSRGDSRVREPDSSRPFEAALATSRRSFLERLQHAWLSDAAIETRLADLEEALIVADVGVRVAQRLLGRVREQAPKLSDARGLRVALRQEMRAILGETASSELASPLHVALVVGVNGVGKTTTIGKLAKHHVAAGRKVLLIAADTFRAAASEQLALWAQRVGADCVRHQGGTDPSAVVYDGLKAAVARRADVVIIDTAGRLHVKANLIEELKKIVRVIGRQIPDAPHETLLVIDGTTGQNAVNQARVFQEALTLSGVILTKLDGTAKGGAVLAIAADLGVPIRYVGYGESPDDLARFNADVFVDALIEPPPPTSGEIA